MDQIYRTVVKGDEYYLAQGMRRLASSGESSAGEVTSRGVEISPLR
jgi:hypothetical protein